jgi:RimJ/RimL family protein N-acetyltransferase
MITFSLEPTDLIQRKLSTKLVITESTDVVVIGQCIDMFNWELDWDGMFNIDTALERIMNGDRLYVARYDTELFGYCWLHQSDESQYKIYNVFSKSSQFKRNYGASDMLYYVISNYVNGNVYANVDSWNRKSINVFRKLGFTQK